MHVITQHAALILGQHALLPVTESHMILFNWTNLNMNISRTTEE